MLVIHSVCQYSERGGVPVPRGQPSEASDNRSCIDETKFVVLRILMKLWKSLPQRLATQRVREKTENKYG